MQMDLIDKLSDDPVTEVFLGRLNAMDWQLLVTIRRLQPAFRKNAGLLEGLRDQSTVVRPLLHENLARHLVFSGAEGFHQWVTERGPGFDVGQIIERVAARKAALPPACALRIARDYLSGLAALHNPGWIHGGLAPRDILVGFDGVTRLDGYGYASAVLGTRAAAASSRRARIAYLAPELLRGASPDARADVFSAAAILFVLLTGWTPFEGSDRSRHVQPPSKIRTELPYACDAILLKALHPSPEQRHPNAGALLGAVQSLRRSMAPEAEADRTDIQELLQWLFPHEYELVKHPGRLKPMRTMSVGAKNGAIMGQGLTNKEPLASFGTPEPKPSLPPPPTMYDDDDPDETQTFDPDDEPTLSMPGLRPRPAPPEDPDKTLDYEPELFEKVSPLVEQPRSRRTVVIRGILALVIGIMVGLLIFSLDLCGSVSDVP